VAVVVVGAVAILRSGNPCGGNIRLAAGGCLFNTVLVTSGGCLKPDCIMKKLIVVCVESWLALETWISGGTVRPSLVRELETIFLSKSFLFFLWLLRIAKGHHHEDRQAFAIVSVHDRNTPEMLLLCHYASIDFNKPACNFLHKNISIFLAPRPRDPKPITMHATVQICIVNIRLRDQEGKR
jgi:hypothetical protein